MDTNSKTFCVLPFIHKHQRLSGVETVCCFSQIPLNKGDLTKVQEKIVNGQRVEHCMQCYLDESKRLESHRLRENERWLKDIDVVEYLKNYIIGNELKTYSYDLRYSNTCNLACIGCMPQQSSLWAKELNITYNYKPTKFSNDEIKDAKWIYLAGGEPFLVEQMIELLDIISKKDQQPSICINTNLTVQDDRLTKICKKLKSLTLHISIDGINSVAEYHRYPMKWSKFERNLDWAKELNCELSFNTIVDAVNVMFVHEIMQYEHLVKNWNLTLMTKPQSLQVKNLPFHLKDIAYKNFATLKSSQHYLNNLSFKNNVEAILDEIMIEGDTQQLSQFITTLDTRRNINHTDYLKINLA